MALVNFLSGSHDTITNNRLVLSNPTEILVTEWTKTGDTWSLATSATGIPLENVVRDSLTISQDDPETTNIDCETSESPIKTVTKQGAWHIEMTCADLQPAVMDALMGYKNLTINGSTPSSGNGDITVAPTTMPQKYVAIEIVFEEASLVCPKVQLASKLDASSLSSETVKVTISGTLMDYAIGSSNEKTPFFINRNQS